MRGGGDGGALVKSSGVPWPGLSVALAVVLLDQASKWWLIEVVMQPPRAIPLTPFLNLVMVWNRGVSFGLLDSNSPLAAWLLVLVALAIIGALAVWLYRAPRPLVVAALGMIIGGAAGNVADRVRFGEVFDFLDIHAAGFHWPAFNVADAGITVGAVALVLESLFARPERHKDNQGTKEGVNDGR